MKKSLCLILLICINVYGVSKKIIFSTTSVLPPNISSPQDADYLTPFLSTVGLDITFNNAFNRKAVKHCSGVIIDNNDFQLTTNPIRFNDASIYPNASQYIASTNVEGHGHYILTDNKCLSISTALSGFHRSKITNIKVHFIISVADATQDVGDGKSFKSWGKTVDYNTSKQLSPLELDADHIFIIPFSDIFNASYDSLVYPTNHNPINNYSLSSSYTFKVLDTMNTVIPDATVQSKFKESQDWAKSRLSMLYISEDVFRGYQQKLDSIQNEINTQATSVDMHRLTKIRYSAKKIWAATYKNFVNLRYVRYLFSTLLNYQRLQYANEVTPTLGGKESFYILYFSLNDYENTKSRQFTMIKLQEQSNVFIKRAYDVNGRIKITAYYVVSKTNPVNLENAPLGMDGAPLVECFTKNEVSINNFNAEEVGEKQELGRLRHLLTDNCKIVGIYNGFDNNLFRSQPNSNQKTKAYEFISINYFTPEFFSEVNGYPR